MGGIGKGRRTSEEKGWRRGRQFSWRETRGRRLEGGRVMVLADSSIEREEGKTSSLLHNSRNRRHGSPACEQREGGRQGVKVRGEKK